MSERNAPYWETPLDLFKLLLTAAAIWAFLGPLGGCSAMSNSADMPDADLPAAGDLGISAPSFNIPEVDLPSMGDMAGFEIDGLALPGSNIEIFDADVSLGNVTADADGRWAFALPALAAGAHALRGVGLDVDGNPFETEGWNFDLPEMPDLGELGDMPLPGAGAIDFSLPDFDFGGIDLPSLGDLKGFELSGLALPGSDVEIFDGDLSLGTVTADADGRWAFALPALAAGAHALRGVGLDVDGNDFETPSWSFDLPEMPDLGELGDMPLPGAGAIDFSLPDFDFGGIDLPSLGDLKGFELSGLALPGSDVEIFDGDLSLGTVTADADGRWRFALPALAAGVHRLFAAGLDADGNPFETPDWSFELPDLSLSSDDVDAADEDAASDASDDADAASGDDAEAATIAPAITGRESELAPGAIIGGTAAPGARLMCYDGDTLLGEVLADADGNWRFTLPAGFSADAIDFRVVAVDEDGTELGEDTRNLRILPAGLPKTGRAPMGG